MIAERERKIASDKNMAWVLARYLNRDDQLVSSWTGFNMLARRNESVLKDTVGYLPTIDSPATQMNTVYEILKNSQLNQGCSESQFNCRSFRSSHIRKGH